jgi:hypothetical protein
MTAAGEADDIRDLAPTEVYRFICNDFETAWNGVAATPDGPTRGGGNFLFAAQSMILLEWICRLCAGDDTGDALADFSRSLQAVRPAYFAGLPTKIGGNASDVPLPRPPTPLPVDETPLLWLLFDVVRNGLVHQYQQIISELPDGRVYISVGGPTAALEHAPALTIEVSRRGGPGRHLKYIERGPTSVGIVLRPEWCYFDFTAAVERAELLARPLIPKGLQRPDKKHQYPNLTADAVRTALQSAGITITVDPGGSWTNASPSSTASVSPPGGLLPPTSWPSVTVLGNDP